MFAHDARRSVDIMVATRTRKPARHPHGRTFVSYAYKDAAALAQLKELHLAGIQLRPFSPISVRPSQMVSTRLLSAIHACSSFIHVDTPNARRSRWVVLETDYARRIGKAVFAFDPRQGRVRHDRATPMHLPVFPSYEREDARDVRDILAIMKTERLSFAKTGAALLPVTIATLGS